MKMSLPNPAKALEYFENKNSFTTGPVEVSYLLKDSKNEFTIVDVRDPDDYKKGHIPSAVNLPRKQWQSAPNLKKDRINILYCYSQTCHLASKAAAILAHQGYPVVEMEGGFDAWKEKGFQVESFGAPETKSRISGMVSDPEHMKMGK